MGLRNATAGILHADDYADALVFLLRNYSGHEHVNVGSGEDVTILEVAELVAEVVGFKGEIVRDFFQARRHPAQAHERRQAGEMGWSPSISLREGIASTYQWFLKTIVRRA